MFSILQEYFSYAFVVRALYVGIFVALCSALLGVSLVLKRYSMIGDGLSHVGFGTLAIAMALNLAPLQVSIPLVLLAAFLLLRVSENSKIKGDAAIALISSSSLALGGIIIAVSTGMGADVCNYMFGAILAMRISDVYLSIGAAAVVLILYLIFYNRIFTVTFDESFAKATGTKVGYYNMLIAFLTALVIVVGMRMMGAMLISGLIIFPALTSMRILKSFKSVVITSAVLAVICFFLGMVLSLIISTPKGGNIPPGASIVAVNLGAFCLFLIIGALKKWNAGRKLRQDLKEAAK